MKEKDREVEYILNLRQEAEDATKDRIEAAKELWSLFQNRQDYSKKKDWQSKVCVPKVYMAVIQAASMVKRAIMSPRKLFKLDTVHPDDEEAKSQREEIELMLKEHVRRSNFVDAYHETMVESFLVGRGITKVLWEGGLRYINVDSAECFIDPDFQAGSGKSPKYIIERKEMDLAELRDMAKRINDESEGKPFNMAEINKIEDFSDTTENYERQMRRDLSNYSSRDKRVKILEFWGDIVSKDGKSLKKNQLRVIANDKYVIRSQDNPFIHESAPYILTIPIIYPHRGVWGISLAEPVARLQYAYNNIMNLIIDNLNFSVNKVFETQDTNLINPRSLTQLYPGKIVHKHTSAPALTEVRTSGVSQDVFYTLGIAESEIQKGTAVTEFLLGTAGKTKTATEAELKTSQAQGLFDTIARDIEQNSLAPLMEMTFDLLVQFANITPALRNRYKLNVGGLSLLLAKRDQMSSIAQTLQLALQSQTIASMTDIKELYQKYLNFHNLEDVFTKGQGPNLDQQQQLQQQAREQAEKEVQGMSEEEIMAAAQKAGI